MPKPSAGLMLYRYQSGELQVFLVHPGGPYWARKNLGAWSIPKGEYEVGEEPLQAAKREFHEETGLVAEGTFQFLGEVKQTGGKIVTAWAIAGDADADALRSNNFQMEWPPRSGKTKEFPEVDQARWFSILEARKHILPGQLPLLNALILHIEGVQMETNAK